MHKGRLFSTEDTAPSESPSVADILLLQSQSKLSQAITQYKSECSLIDCIGMKTEENDCLNNPYLAKQDVDGTWFA